MDDLQYYFVVLLLWLGFMVLIQGIGGKLQNKPPLPPSPRALPIIGHMHHLGLIAHRALHKVSSRHGPLVYLFIGSIPNLLVSSPEMAKEILKTNEFNFLNRPKIANIDYITYGSADFSTAPYGPYWKFMKKIFMTELLSGRTLDNFIPIRREEIKKLLERLSKKAEAGETVNLSEQLKKMTNNIISKMAFRGRHSDSHGDEVVQVVKELNELAGFFNLSETFWFLRKWDIQGIRKRLKNARDKYDAIIERIMEEHENYRKKTKETAGRAGNTGVKNLLDILLDLYEDEHVEMKLTRENIKGFIMNIYGAGTDTSATTVEWAIAELINHPNIMKKAQQEIDAVVGKSRIAEESDVCNLTYLQAIVKETLRLHPAGPLFVRESAEECIISGYRIPARTRLIVNVWAIGRDPSHGEAPLEFRPERFLGKEWSTVTENTLSFGIGRRSCPGEKMALRFVPTAIAAIIQCFELEVNGALDMQEGPGSTLPRAKPLVCAPKARLKSLPHKTNPICS